MHNTDELSLICLSPVALGLGGHSHSCIHLNRVRALDWLLITRPRKSLKTNQWEKEPLLYEPLTHFPPALYPSLST